MYGLVYLEQGVLHPCNLLKKINHQKKSSHEKDSLCFHYGNDNCNNDDDAFFC